MIKSGISQIGGKFRLRKQLLNFTPSHHFFLSLFCGACHYELNKPRTRYECFNDLNSEFINYLLMIRQYPKKFDEFKKGVLGLVSHEVVKRIKKGELKPKNNLEKAYFFYYLNKLTFASSEGGIGNKPSRNCFRGITLPTVCKEKTIKEIRNSYKGINPKTTRPYTNNDCGLLTPIDSNAIERLRYVNLTCYDFEKAYYLFYRAFYKRKGLTKECFIYADPPYPSNEKYYGTMFPAEKHQKLIEIMIETPFNFMLSIGGDCKFYLDALENASNWRIKKVKVKYSSGANNQIDTIEYICMNYNINKLPKILLDNYQTIEEWV